MKKLINKIENSQLFKAALTLGLATIIGQVISIISQPILTRLCSPEELGVYGIVTSMASIVIPIASLKLEFLIVTEKDDDKADRITQTCCRLTFLVAVLFLIYSIIMYVLGSYNFIKMGICIVLFPVLIIAHGLRVIFAMYNNRFSEYKMLANLNVLRSLIRTLIQLLSSIIGGGSIGLTIGYSISPIYGIRTQTRRYREKLKHCKELTISQSIQIVKDNLSHIINLVPAEFANTCALSAITLTISGLFGTTIVGYYSLSIRVLAIPLSLISVNVSQVFLRKITTVIQEKQSAYECCIKTMKALSIISCTGFTVLFFIAPYVCEIIFGEGWKLAGIYISILSPMYALNFVASSLISVYVVAEKQRNQLIIQSTFLVTCGLLYLFAIMFKWNIELYLIFISIIYTIIYIIMLFDIVRICKGVDDINFKQK